MEEYKVMQEKPRQIWTPRRIFSRFGFAYVLFFAVMSVIMMVLGGIMMVMQDALGESQALMVPMVISYLAAAPAAWLVIRKIPKVELRKTGKVSAGNWIAIFLVAMGCTYVGNLVGQVFMMFWSMITGIPVTNDVQVLVETTSPAALFLPVVIVAPIIEELIFRKFLLDRIAIYGDVMAILVSGILFGLGHGNFFQFFYAFMLGMIFAYVYLQTGNFWYVASFHMAVNFMGSMVPMLLLYILEVSPVVGSFVSIGYSLLLLAFMGSAVFLLIHFRKSFRLLHGSQERPKNEWFGMVAGNGGMITYLVWMAGSFAINFVAGMFL